MAIHYGNNCKGQERLKGADDMCATRIFSGGGGGGSQKITDLCLSRLILILLTALEYSRHNNTF
jgi:hypothetical protein